MKKIKPAPRRYIKELPGGSFRDCTDREVSTARHRASTLEWVDRQMARYQKMHNDIVRNCKHDVQYDEPGIPYDIRRCLVCGEGQPI